MKPSCNVAALIERYFTERLMRQRNVSANTIASYRDTFRLLFMFAQASLRKPPSTWPSTIWMCLSSARSLLISRRSAAPASGRVTCA
jgi:site-specific recombinase XerD